jgi:hypothetical protein
MHEWKAVTIRPQAGPACNRFGGAAAEVSLTSFSLNRPFETVGGPTSADLISVQVLAVVHLSAA